MMPSPRLHTVTCSSPGGLHRMAYQEWGEADNPEVVLCVHGLTRTGRDFDTLAQQLARRYRVVCPDVVGRGLSDRLALSAFYAVPQYTADMVTLLAKIQPQKLHWIGTSMGGLIGMTYAGLLSQLQFKNASLTPAQQRVETIPSGLRLDSIILNDVGPHIEPVALERIGDYLGKAVSVDSFEEAVAYVRQTCVSFGPHRPEQWNQLTEYVFVKDAGKWSKHYDLAIAQAFKQVTPELAAQGEAFLWGAYAALTAPIQIIRGQESDLLSMATVQKMLQLQPGAQLAQLSGVGHAPTLMNDAQIDVVLNFLQRQPS